MPPSLVGARQHSIRRTCSGMSKWVPCSSAIAWSASACIQSRNASLPCDACGPGRRRAPRPPRRRVAPGPTILPATARISVSSRASSSKPQAYVSSQVDRGAEEVLRGQLVALAAGGLLLPAERGQLARAGTAPNSAVAAVAAAAPRSQLARASVAVRAEPRRPGPGRSCRRRGRSRCRTAWPPRASACRGADVAVRRPPRSRVRWYCVERAGERVASRAAMLAAASSPSVGIRSKTCARRAARWRSR